MESEIWRAKRSVRSNPGATVRSAGRCAQWAWHVLRAPCKALGVSHGAEEWKDPLGRPGERVRCRTAPVQSNLLNVGSGRLLRDGGYAGCYAGFC